MQMETREKFRIPKNWISYLDLNQKQMLLPTSERIVIRMQLEHYIVRIWKTPFSVDTCKCPLESESDWISRATFREGRTAGWNVNLLIVMLARGKSYR